MAIPAKSRGFYLAPAIFTIWLFHLSAIIGVSLGYEEWFITKTPLNLTVALLLSLFAFPLLSPRQGLLAILFFLIGMSAEWIGVRNDWVFGAYYYGDNLGPKFQGVPYLIGVNWMLLTFATAGVMQELSKHKVVRVLFGAALMILLDFFMEQTAHRFDFWHFAGDLAPLRNYLAWYLIALVLHTIYQFFGERVKANFAGHLYLANLVFFVWFFIYYQ